MANGKQHLYKKRSQIRSIWFRYRKNRLALLGLVILGFMLFMAATADIFFDYEAHAVAQNIRIRFTPPCGEHFLGTDEYGRDVLARIVYGARISLFVGIATVLFSLSVGSVIGACAAYYGGRTDNILMRFMDVVLAIPGTLLAISIVAALGSGIGNLLVAMSISQVPRMARVVRSSILTIKGQDYIEAAKAFGTKDRRIIFKQILPNAIGPIIVQATLTVARTILMVSSLSFVGLGISSPTPEWGCMLSEAKSQLRYNAYLAISPGVAIVMTVMSFTLIGDGLRDALDPRMKN